jgi:hypothetical protein
MSAARWIKQEPGFYTLDGTDYAVASMNAMGEDDQWVTRMEWAVVRFTSPTQRGSQDGENVNWFDTMREARAVAERLAAS